MLVPCPCLAERGQRGTGAGDPEAAPRGEGL